MKLTDRDEVKQEYADESRHDIRRAAFTDWLVGENAKDVAFDLVIERRPRDVLEVGCGDGAFAVRVQEHLGAQVTAVDISPRMVALAREQGVRAGVGDVAALPFPDSSFDLVVANWMLYHAEDLDQALTEIARVLRPGGALIAATLGVENMKELWQLVRAPEDMSDYTFTRESGSAALEPHFKAVRQRDVDARIAFPDAGAVKGYVSVALSRDHLADRVPDDLDEFSTRTSQAVFVAEV